MNGSETECAAGMLSPARYFEEGKICFDGLSSARVPDLSPMADDDFDLTHAAQQSEAAPVAATIPMKVVVLDNALHKQLPLHTPLGVSPIYGWLEMNDISPQAFGTAFLKHISNGYQKFDSNLNVISISSFVSDQDFLNRLRSKQNGRMLFHYVGYGFPPISADRIWLPGPVELKIKNLFTSFQTPSFFIFDCDNAGVAIDTFAELHPQTSLTAKRINPKAYHDSFFPQTEWNDYFVMCATSKGEELPNDPVFPKDLLTSILLTPVKASLYISRYTYYRSSMDGLSNEPNYTEKQIAELQDLLDVIIDSIVCDCLPSTLLHRFFRGKGTTNVLFKNFVLAQYLLRPLGIHPISKPELPDMSQHRLWEYWKAVIDNTIGSVNRSGMTLTEEYYKRAVLTFTCFLDERDYRRIPPSLLETMMQVGNYEGTSRLLLEYPPAKDLLCDVIVVENMFAKLLTVRPEEPVFKSLCHLVICVLSTKFNRVYEIPAAFNWKYLLDLILKKTVPAMTRALVATILACSAEYSKDLRSLIATTETFQYIQSGLGSSPPLLFVWLLMLIKRAFDVFPAEPAMFGPSGFHIQSCVYSFHHSPECRAAALTVLPSFFQGNQLDINMQMLVYVLPTFTDMSYLVRYQLMLLIVRFLRIHQDEIDQPLVSTTHTYKSFNSLTERLFKLPTNGDVRTFFSEIDAKIAAHRAETCQLLYDLSNYLTHDPHPVIAKEAATTCELFTHGDDESLFLPGEGDSDALFNIVMRETLKKNLEDTPNATREPLYQLEGDSAKTPKPVTLVKTIPLSIVPTRIAFDTLTCGIAAAHGNSIYYFEGSHDSGASVSLLSAQITDLKIACWFDEPCAIVGDSNGTCALWKVRNAKPSAVWRTDPNINSCNLPVYLALASDRPRLATVRGSDYTVLWDVATLRMVSEFENFENTKATAIALHPSDSNILCTGFEDGSISVRDTRTSTIAATFRNAPFPVIKVVGNARENSTIYWAHQNGSVFRRKGSTTDSISLMSKYELRDFDAHPTLPLLLFAPKTTTRATFATDDGKFVHVVKGIPAGSIAAIHPTQNIFAFGTPDQEIRIYQSHV